MRQNIVLFKPVSNHVIMGQRYQFNLRELELEISTTLKSFN